MLKIQSGDKVTQALGRELIRKLSDSGAFFHSDLRLQIRGAEGGFSAVNKFKSGEELIRLPLSCMPLFSDFHWFLDDDQRLCWESIEKPLAKDHVFHCELVDLLVNLYRHLDKVAAYSRLSPIIEFVNKRALLEWLSIMDHDDSLLAKVDQGLDQLMIHVFWQARIFSDYLTQAFHLIPAMEFLDHSTFADNFFWDNLEGGQRALHYAFQPVSGSKALLARYEIMDNFHAFMKYGFVDDNTFFLQSQPFTLQLDDGVSLEIKYQSASGNQCHLQDWQTTPNYNNSIMYRSALRLMPDKMIMPFMLMPPPRHMPAFDEALAAQLQEAERHMGISGGKFANPKLMQRIKIGLLEKNEEAYRTLAAVARDAQLNSAAPATRLLKKMLKHQLKIINEFKQAVS
jgi:hypothetical protein